MKYRAVFISDVQLGTRSCKAKQLVSFLKKIECESLYLVGDIIDFWNLNTINKYWDKHNTEVIRILLKKSKNGTKIFYVIGNHDEYLRTIAPFEIGGISILNTVSHETISGFKYLVIHGDQFDSLMHSNRGLYIIGSLAYDWLVVINHYYNEIRKFFNYPYWSLSMFLKLKAKEAVGLIQKFEGLLISYAHKMKYDGVICGHIHNPEVNYDTMYCNTGDWVENMSYLYEDLDGNVRLGYYQQ